MNWTRITARQNPTVKDTVLLTKKKERDAAGVFLAEGKTLFLDLCQMGIYPEKVFLSEDASLTPEEVEKASPSSLGYLLLPSVFEKITTEKGSEGILSVFSRDALPSLNGFSSSSRLVALENVQDPGNVGTLIRTAASLGMDGVLLCGCADPFGPKAIRASMGAIAHVPIKLYSSTADLMDEMEREGVRTIAATLSPDSETIEKTSLAAPLCILLGNEGRGLSEEAISRSTAKSIIPISGVESLNVAAAGTIFIWEILRRGGSHEG